MAWRFYTPSGEIIESQDHGNLTGLGDDDHPQYVQKVGGSSAKTDRLQTLHGEGCLTSLDTDTLHDINVAAGKWRDIADDSDIILASEITKRVDATWAVGDDNGGLDTGSVAASETYHVFVIERSDTGVVDVLFSLSPSSPTMPTDYDSKRRIASLTTDGSADWTDYIQVEREFYLATGITDIDDTNPGTGAITRTLSSCVTDISVWALVTLSIGGNQAAAPTLSVTDLNRDDIEYGLGLGQCIQGGGAGANNFGQLLAWVRTNTSAQIRSRINASDATTLERIGTHGWIDYAGTRD